MRSKRHHKLELYQRCYQRYPEKLYLAENKEKPHDPSYHHGSIMTKRKPRDFSGLFLFMQKRNAYLSVEKVNERAHEKGCHNCADTNKGRNGRKLAAAQKEQGDAKNNTGKICADADEFEFADLPFVCHDEGDGIIGGYAKVCGDVDRTAEAEGHKTENEAGNTNHHGCIGEDGQQGVVGKLHHIT